MNNEFSYYSDNAQKYAPGQVWRMEIDTTELDGAWVKKDRPYLIISANKYRLILLKFTHGGEKESEHLYKVGITNKGESRIVLDKPISVDISHIKSEPEYKETFKKKKFFDILNSFLNVILENSLDDGFIFNGIANDTNSEEIIKNDIIKERYSEKINKMKTIDAIDESTSGNTDKHQIKTIDIPDAINIKPKTSDNALVKDIDGVPLKKRLINNKGHHIVAGVRDTIRPTDVFIFGSNYRTKDTDVYNELNRLCFANPKFEMSSLINNKKVVYVNNRYNVQLKSSMKPAENIKILMADVEEVGIKNAAKIWNKSYQYIWKLYNTNKKGF